MVRLVRVAGGDVSIQGVPKSLTKGNRNNLYKKQGMKKPA
jgi:hypothetical protein